jgi:DNA-binding transcriptional LysR family regulator
MDLYQIKYFLAIVETGGFTKASERLFVSQPSLSAGIKKLEQELGVILFERGGRRAVLTPAGQFFLEKAKAILSECQSVLQEMKSFRSQPVLRLGVLQSIRIGSLARLISAFRQEHPHVAIELRDGSPKELLYWLEKGEIDLAMTVLHNANKTENSLTLFRQRFALAVASTHPFAQRKSIRLADIEGQPYIDRLHCEMWEGAKQACETQGIHRQIVYRADNEEWVISLVAAGLGITIMPDWQEPPEVTYIPFSDWTVYRTLGLIWRVRQGAETIAIFRSFAASHAWKAI